MISVQHKWIWDQASTREYTDLVGAEAFSPVLGYVSCCNLAMPICSFLCTYRVCSSVKYLLYIIQSSLLLSPCCLELNWLAHIKAVAPVVHCFPGFAYRVHWLFSIEVTSSMACSWIQSVISVCISPQHGTDSTGCHWSCSLCSTVSPVPDCYFSYTEPHAELAVSLLVSPAFCLLFLEMFSSLGG